jgi:formate dehydrogenase major subunit
MVRPAIEPLGDAKPDWQIIQELSNRLDYAMDYDSPRSIQEEIARLTPSYGGITYERLLGDGLQWPCPTPEHLGTKFLHQDRFTRGKGLFHAIEYRPPAELTDDDYPFHLTTGRLYVHYHTGTMTRNSPSLNREITECFVEMNPVDAAALGIANGEVVLLESRRGSVSTKIRLTRTVPERVLFMPFHFLESRANILTNPAFDPIAKIPEYKVCAVKVKRMD